MHTINMPSDVYSNLQAHLFSEGDDREQAAFLFCRAEEGSANYEVVDIQMLGNAEFAHQRDTYLELKDETRVRLIKLALELDASIVETHSHPWPGADVFSLADRIGLAETVPHMFWRLHKRPYFSLVFAPDGFDALVWIYDATDPKPLKHIDINTALLKPSNRSLGGWS
jgi:hypothetical protein